MTLRKRLLLWYSGVFLLLATVMVGVIYLLVSHAMHREFAHYLSEEYDEAQRIVASHWGDDSALRQAVSIEVEGNKDFPLSYWIYDAKTQSALLAMAPRWEALLTGTPQVSADGERPLSTHVALGSGSSETIYFLTGWADRDRLPGLVLQVGMSDQRVHRRLRLIARYLVGVWVLGIGLSAAGAWVLAGRSLRPMDEVASALERIQAQDLSDRLPGPAVQDEIGRIVSSVNDMLARLEDAFRRMTSFTADAAHELRTPLTTLKCQLDLAARQLPAGTDAAQELGSARQEVDHLTTLVGNLLLLAGLDAQERAGQVEPVDLGAIFDDIVEVFEVMASEKGVSLDVEVQDGCGTHGDRTLLRRLFSNLIENAVRHTPAGGRVDVTAARGAGGCSVAVADTGPGIEPRELEMIFERFYRTEKARSRDSHGVGLGLSISKRIVELHGGSIRVESRPGQGTTFTVTLPDGAP